MLGGRGRGVFGLVVGALLAEEEERADDAEDDAFGREWLTLRAYALVVPGQVKWFHGRG
jgi:hypothetical protein